MLAVPQDTPCYSQLLQLSQPIKNPNVEFCQLIVVQSPVSSKKRLSETNQACAALSSIETAHSHDIQLGQTLEQLDAHICQLVEAKIPVGRFGQLANACPHTFKPLTAPADWSALQTDCHQASSAHLRTGHCACESMLLVSACLRVRVVLCAFVCAVVTQKQITHSACSLVRPSNSPSLNSGSWLSSTYLLQPRLLLVATCAMPRLAENQ
jgi:hypothetical protein